MKATLIGGEAHGKVIEIEDGRLSVDMLDPIGRIWRNEAQRWVIGQETLTFFVISGMPYKQSEALIRKQLAASEEAFEAFTKMTKPWRPCRDLLTPVGDIDGCVYQSGHYGDHKSIVDGKTYLWDVCRQDMCLQWEEVAASEERLPHQ